MMEAITLWRPWELATLYGGKDVENRSWVLPFRMRGKPFALHAGQKFDKDGEATILRILGIQSLAELWHGASEPGVVVGVASVDRVVQPGDRLDKASESPWLFGPWGWVWRDVRALPRPVPCKGRQGFWRLPPAVEAAVREQLP